MWSKLWIGTKKLLATRTRIVVALGIFLLLSWFFSTSDVFVSKGDVSNFRNVLNMAIDGNEFWVAKAHEQGLLTPVYLNDTVMVLHESDRSAKTCNEFFVIWPGDCVKSHSYLDERIRTLSAQMMVMNTTLNFFTTDLKGCHWEGYTGVKVKLFNATEELTNHGFATALPIINKWDKTRFTRLSDILRLCIAHRHHMSYLDSDVHFLQLQRGFYENAYVGAQLWSDSKNAIEITNAAFCLPPSILEDMMGFQLSVIMRKREGIKQKYFYTELGPSMFHHVLFNRHAVTLYSQNNPAEPSLDRIARDIHAFGHKQLHLTGKIRKGNKDLKFDELVNNIRLKSGLPLLDIPASSSH